MREGRSVKGREDVTTEADLARNTVGCAEVHHDRILKILRQNVEQGREEVESPILSTFEKHRRVFGGKMPLKPAVTVKIPMTKKSLSQQHLVRLSSDDKENNIEKQIQTDKENKWNSDVAICYDDASPRVTGFSPPIRGGSTPKNNPYTPLPLPQSPVPITTPPQNFYFQSSPPKGIPVRSPHRILNPKSPTAAGLTTRTPPKINIRASPKVSTYTPKSLTTPISPSLGPKQPKSPISPPISPNGPPGTPVIKSGPSAIALSDQKRFKARLAKSALDKWHQR